MMGDNMEFNMSHQFKNDVGFVGVVDEMETRKFLNFCSVPSSPVTEPVQISEFLNKTPIPNPALKAAKWVPGVPTPIQEGLMSPNMEAINLIAGFASGCVTIDGNDLKHIPSISKSLSEVWETLNKWVPVDSGAIRAKKTVIAHKEPHKNVSRQIVQKEPCTRVSDSEIKLSNIIPGSPAFVPYKWVTPKGKGKGMKYINIGSNPTTFDSDMARFRRMLTKEEWLKVKAKWAKKATEDWKQVIKQKRKPHSTKGDGKTSHKQLVAKSAKMTTSGSGSMPKPRKSSAVIVFCEIRKFQKSVNLLITLLPFQRLVHEITQDCKPDLRFQSSAILALQEATESWLVSLFESANLCAIHRGYQTIAPKDFWLVRSIHHIACINMWWR